eukprot:ANDGO_02860.mRNA.1 putative signal peptidase complex subunit 2
MDAITSLYKRALSLGSKSSNPSSTRNSSGAAGASMPNGSSASPTVKHVNLHDLAGVRRLLDDEIRSLIPSLGYELQHHATDAKHLLSLLACLTALAAHFFIGPFPANRTKLALCCAVFFALAIAIELLSYVVGRSCVLFATAARKSKPKHAPVIRIDSTIRGSDAVYAVSFSTLSNCGTVGLFSRYTGRNNTSRGGASQSNTKSIEAPIATFFTSKGEFADAAFSAWIAEHLFLLKTA